jgi:hypothetical protein
MRRVRLFLGVVTASIAALGVASTAGAIPRPSWWSVLIVSAITAAFVVFMDLTEWIRAPKEEDGVAPKEEDGVPIGRRRAYLHAKGGSWYIAAAIFGLIPLMVGIAMWYDNFRAYEYGPPAMGVVEKVNGDGTGSVRFYVDGQPWVFVDEILAYEVGETAVVAYDPEDPSRYAAVRPHLVDESVQWWFLGVGVLILGLDAFFFVRGKAWRWVE